MRAEAVSSDVWGIADSAPREQRYSSPARVLPVLKGWSPERFAQEQINALVRQIFSPSLKPPVRQVVFSGVEPQSDIRGICSRIAATMARDSGDVVLVGDGGEFTNITVRSSPSCKEMPPFREGAVQLQQNLWYAPLHSASGRNSTSAVHAYLSQVRREFEYSVIVAPSAAESDEAMATAQFADGIVLVLSAGRTRRATACRIKKSLDAADVRLLGVVLSDREFPVPYEIYKRL